MGGIEGARVGNYDGLIYGKNEITAGKAVGKKEGYASLDQALSASKAAGGAEVISQKDGKYFLNEVRGTHYTHEGSNEVSVRAYPEANFSKIVAFVDDHDNVIAQYDNDANLELLGKVDQVKAKIATMSSTVASGTALKIAGAMLGVGSPETMRTSEKLSEALSKMPKYLPDSLRQKFEAMLKPESLAILGTVLGAYAVSHAFGVGEVADVVLVGAGLAFLGADAIKVAGNFYDFATIAADAKTDQELEQAAAHLAEGISTVLFDGAAAVVGARAASGAGKGGAAMGQVLDDVAAHSGGGLQLATATVGGGRVVTSGAAATAGGVRTTVASGGIVTAPHVLQSRAVSGSSGGGSVTPAQKFYGEISKLPPNERVPVVRQRADEFAKSKGWEKAPDIGKKNGGRIVYRDKVNDKLYSVDTQHGHFEVLNSRGKHQGSIDLWGNEVPGKLDRSGGHDLRVK